MPPHTPAGTSQSWTSPLATHLAKLQRLQNSANHLGFGTSPFFPHTLHAYMRHQAEYADACMERERERLGVRIMEVEGRRRLRGGMVEGEREGEGEEEEEEEKEECEDFCGEGDEDRDEDEGGDEEPSNAKEATREAAKSLLSTIASDPLFRAALADHENRPSGATIWKTSPAPLIAQKPGYTPVLKAPTAIWSGTEHTLPPGRRNPTTSAHRAAWPDLSELKSSGAHRHDIGKDRRFPLPRKDLMNREAVVKAVGSLEGVGVQERDARVLALCGRSGEGIPWGDREVIRFWDFDRLEGVSRERKEETERRRSEGLGLGPLASSGLMGVSPGGHGYQYGYGHQNRGANLTLRGGHSNAGRSRGFPVPVQPRVSNPEAVSYGADGLGDYMKRPPLGGWEFDEEWLKQKGEWKDLLEKHV